MANRKERAALVQAAKNNGIPYQKVFSQNRKTFYSVKLWQISENAAKRKKRRLETAAAELGAIRFKWNEPASWDSRQPSFIK